MTTCPQIRARHAAKIGLAALCGALVSGAPSAKEPQILESPELCAMLVAFDSAMQERFYQANFAPHRMDCSFIGAQGCSFATPNEVVIRITHVRSLGCDEGGDCHFMARQTCEAEQRAYSSCQALMPSQTADYIVSGEYQPQDSGAGWRLVDWRRDPAPAVTAMEYEIDRVCPAS